MPRFALLVSFLTIALSRSACAEDIFASEYLGLKNKEITNQYVAGAGKAIYTMKYRLEVLGANPLSPASQKFSPPWKQEAGGGEEG